MNNDVNNILIQVTERFLGCDKKEAEKETNRWLKIVHQIMEEEE